MPPLAEGFAQIAEYIKAAGRPLTSFCACELRSPAAFTDQGFLEFNQHYVKTLAEWGIYDGKTNPVARSNVCPEIDPPSEPSFYAFSLRAAEQQHDADLRHRRQRRSRRKAPGPIPSARCVIAISAPTASRTRFAMSSAPWRSRMGAFGFGWKDATAAQVYTIRDYHHVVADELVKRGAARPG